MQVLQAMAFTLAGHHWRQVGDQWIFGFQIRIEDGTGVADFFPEQDHPIVMSEAYGLLVALLAG